MTMDNKEKPTPLECAYNRMVKSTKTSGRINGEGYFTPNIFNPSKQPIDPESMGTSLYGFDLAKWNKISPTYSCFFEIRLPKISLPKKS